MKSCVLRSLVLVCSLTMALPQGWCCMFAAPKAKAATTNPGKATEPVHQGECCPCCQNTTNESQDSAERPAPSEKPAPTDQPPVPQKIDCCCADRNATLSSTVSVEPVEMGYFAILSPPQISLPSVTLVEGVIVSVVHPPTQQLNLFNCVWLC